MSSVFDGVEIPYGCYWSTPFTKWQGSLQHLHALKFAAWVAKREMSARKIDAAAVESAVFGMTVIQRQSFYGTPWFTGLAGLATITGPVLSQACATGVRVLFTAAQEITGGLSNSVLTVSGDRCSNGAHVYYPEPSGPGGTGEHEDWVLDNFSCDPLGNNSMTQTAENVAKKHGVDTAEQHQVVLRRLEQYAEALANEHAFQKRYMSLPFEVPTRNYKKIERTIAGDEGVFQSTAEGLAKLKPVLEGGTVTFGGQTHPADGNAGMIVTTAARAAELSHDKAIRVRILGFGMARAAQAYMPEAPVPAAQRALLQAGLKVSDLHAVKTHNPFAVNDIVFARQTGFPIEKINNFGCSLVWGHPQGPTGLRSVIELIEELAIRGGGIGLFTGCAAGDSSMAVVIKVGDK
jgi:acetyl-CoA acetyltransferase